MAFTKITNAELNAVGATTQPNVPTIGATALKQVFDAPAKQVVAPKVNNLIDELQASTAAADLGAVAPTGRTGSTVQSVLNSLSTDLGTAEAQSHAHPNKAVIDKFADDGTGLTYDGNPVGAVTSVNSQTGAVVLTASDVGALPASTPIPTKTSDLTNDSGFITASSLPTRTSQLTNDSGFITSGDIPTIPTKTSDLTNDSNFVADSSYVHTDNNYDATAKGIVDGATAAIAAKSTVAWNQNITTGQKIATVTIDGTPTDVYAPTGGGGGGGAVDSVNGQTGIVTLGVGDLDDVSVSSLGQQQTLLYDGTEWGNEALADVALSGSYNDLSDKPTIPAAQVNSNWNATSGVAQILNKPTIPTITDTYSATSSNGMSGKAVAQAIASIHGGGMLPYLYIDSEAGATVTVNQPDGTTITPTPAGSGHWECELTGGYGTYVIHSVLSGQGDATQSLAVDTVKEYHVTDTHYDYTINVTAPSGSSIRITGGSETYTGTGTGSSQAFAVHTPSTTYTVAVTMDGNTKSETITSAATSGQSGSVTIAFGTINLTYANGFRGKTITCTKSGVTVTKTAPSSGNTMTFRVPTTGTWAISGTVSGTAYSVNANVTSLSTAVSANLQTTINVNVTMYGAVGAVITYTDANGSQTQTLDSTGKKTNVTISVMPSSPTIVFTDTTVAKNPDNLSNSYTKSVTITNGMTDIYVMPDNALYWYGWMADVEHTQSGKQQGSGVTSCTLEMQTNGIRYNGVGTSNGAYIRNLGFNKLLHTSDKIKCIISDCSSGASFYGNVGASATYGSNSFLTEKQAFNSTAANASGLYTKELTQDGYPGVESLTNYNSSFTLRALWYE